MEFYEMSLIVMFGIIFLVLLYAIYRYIKSSIKNPVQFKADKKELLSSLFVIVGFIMFAILLEYKIPFLMLIALAIGLILVILFLPAFPLVLYFVGVAFIVALFVKLVIYFINVL